MTFDDGTTAEADLVGPSETNDLAVIKVDGGQNLTPAIFAQVGSALKVGQASSPPAPRSGSPSR